MDMMPAHLELEARIADTRQQLTPSDLPPHANQNRQDCIALTLRSKAFGIIEKAPQKAMNPSI